MAEGSDPDGVDPSADARQKVLQRFHQNIAIVPRGSARASLIDDITKLSAHRRRLQGRSSTEASQSPSAEMPDKVNSENEIMAAGNCHSESPFQHQSPKSLPSERDSSAQNEGVLHSLENETHRGTIPTSDLVNSPDNSGDGQASRPSIDSDSPSGEGRIPLGSGEQATLRKAALCNGVQDPSPPDSPHNQLLSTTRRLEERAQHFTMRRTNMSLPVSTQPGSTSSFHMGMTGPEKRACLRRIESASRQGVEEWTAATQPAAATSEDLDFLHNQELVIGHPVPQFYAYLDIDAFESICRRQSPMPADGIIRVDFCAFRCYRSMSKSELQAVDELPRMAGCVRLPQYPVELDYASGRADRPLRDWNERLKNGEDEYVAILNRWAAAFEYLPRETKAISWRVGSSSSWMYHRAEFCFSQCLRAAHERTSGCAGVHTVGLNVMEWAVYLAPWQEIHADAKRDVEEHLVSRGLPSLPILRRALCMAYDRNVEMFAT